MSQRFGDVADPAILLVMGATASMVWWPDDFCRKFSARGFQIIRFDHRDTGQSTTYPPGKAAYSLDDMAADVIAILDGCGIEKAHLVGMSLGGYLSQQVALQHPERIMSLTLIASEPIGGDPSELPSMSDQVLNHFAELAGLDWHDTAAITYFEMELARICTGDGRVFDELATKARIECELARTSCKQSAFNHAMLTGFANEAGTVAEISVPVLVIHGSDDKVLPLENGKSIARQARLSELLILDGAGHELNSADQAAIIQAIVQHAHMSEG